MKRKLELRLLLVLLILLVIPFYLPFVVDSGDLTPPQNPSILNEKSTASENDFTLTWTSRWQNEPLPVENYSTIVGDHIALRSSWESPVNSSRISIRAGQNETGLDVAIDSEIGNPSEVVFDTYSLLRNITVNITLFGWNDTDVMTVEFRNITLGNYFVPVFSDSVAQEIGSSVWNISWSCADKNANDINYFSVWISQDSGVTFYLLARNLTRFHYLWDSSGYLILDSYVIRIRAYSLDLTFGNYCSTAYPPFSYWPGDYSEFLHPISAGDAHIGPPGPVISLNHPSDIIYTVSSTGNMIVWEPNFHSVFQGYVKYEIHYNRSFLERGTFNPLIDKSIKVDVDGLDVGVHEFRIYIGARTLDIVLVTVLPWSSFPDSPMFQMVHYASIGVSIGSIVVILMVVVKTLQLRSDYLSKMMN